MADNNIYLKIRVVKLPSNLPSKFLSKVWTSVRTGLRVTDFGRVRPGRVMSQCDRPSVWPVFLQVCMLIKAKLILTKFNRFNIVCSMINFYEDCNVTGKQKRKSDGREIYKLVHIHFSAEKLSHLWCRMWEHIMQICTANSVEWLWAEEVTS